MAARHFGMILWERFKDQFRYRDPLIYNAPWDYLVRGVHIFIEFVKPRPRKR